ncbi:MAG: NADH-quinone oxidoreductase subunit C [Candidatus Binatia bacterium]
MRQRPNPKALLAELAKMDAREIYASLERLFPGKVGNFKGDVAEPYFTVDGAAIVEICRFLKNSPGYRFEVLSDLTALDWPKEEKIQVVYHLFSYAQNHQIVLKVDLPRGNPKVDTVEEIWKVANWFEREVYDLFGVIFEGHSDLRRIMLPEDWVGYPLRKDYVEQEEYDGISTQRAPLVEKLLR